MSPKLGIVVGEGPAELWLLGGTGAQNTDARASRSGYGAFVRGYAAELGVRFRPSKQASAAFAAWASRVEKHQVWLPTDATTSTAPETSRFGLDARFAAELASWLSCDASVSIARGRSVNVEPQVLPGAPRLIANGGITAHHAGSFGGLRVRALGQRATTDEQLQAAGFALIDLAGGQRWRMFDVNLTIENLLDAGWRELQIASDVRTSRRVDITHDLLTTTGSPRTVMVTLGYAQ